jgi:nitroimidazol reductase NimA-like FMN-containing flavoprotein (pyridoxamine 5'-phosphate oxidase superfamily)
LTKLVKVDPWAGAMSERETLEFLQNEVHLLRIGIVDNDGYPLVHPVWFVYENEKFLIVSERNSAKVKILNKNNKVYFVVDNVTEENGPIGVRGRGVAKIIDDSNYAQEVMRKLILRYMRSLERPIAKKLMESAKSDSVVIEVYPKFLGTWRGIE